MESKRRIYRWDMCDELDQSMKPSTKKSKSDSAFAYKACVVPVASDGTWFGPHLARSGDKYTLGPKGKEIQVKGLENALDMLTRMPVAEWRRPNKNGH